MLRSTKYIRFNLLEGLNLHIYLTVNGHYHLKGPAPLTVVTYDYQSSDLQWASAHRTCKNKVGQISIHSFLIHSVNYLLENINFATLEVKISVNKIYFLSGPKSMNNLYSNFDYSNTYSPLLCSKYYFVFHSI